MIRWGTLMAGMLGFIMVLALGLSMGKAWERTLTSALFGALAFGLIRLKMCLNPPWPWCVFRCWLLCGYRRRTSPLIFPIRF